MTKFETVYAQLNSAQKEAVDTVYGPVLVLAGPGTGKTQLLSARVAHILQVTDALPHNIVCLTFTENGALNMRERLTDFIGQGAYDVHISTYHAFGSAIIGRYPEYFTEQRLERPVDELGKRQIVSDIVDTLSYRNPLKQARHHLGDLLATLSEVKRALLTPDALRTIAHANLRTIEATQSEIAAALAPFAARLPGTYAVAEPVFQRIYAVLCTSEHSRKTVSSLPAAPHITLYNVLAARELESALERAADANKTTPLTAWKNKWLVKNSDNQYVLAGGLETARVQALADILERYEAALAEKGLYDFDDMILRVIATLERNDELRYTLQEQYQFMLLDEFQDTNAAQLRLVELLSNNPVHEGRPNVLAVGDDDQAIYAFQGADVSNMLDFYRLYSDVRVISLEENYRSRAEILAVAAPIASQVSSRLHTNFAQVQKTLVAKHPELPAATIERRTYASDVAEQTGVAERIRELIDEGIAPESIAVLAPKHAYLESLVPYLHAAAVPVAYEKRENVLDAPVVHELVTMSKLIVALHSGNHLAADAVWVEVLSYQFWGFNVADIWRLSWQARDTRRSWSAVLLEHPEFRHAALLVLRLAAQAATEPLETVLDALIGTTEVATGDRGLPTVRSPLRDYYLRNQGESVLYETAAQLRVLRSKLREHQQAAGRPLLLPDLLAFVTAYEDADQPLLNTSPYHQSSNAVQLMTVYKAKGLEFHHVFLVACSDHVWGSRAGGSANRLTLPANLAWIRHSGTTDDERLRLLFVALTRARYGLHLTSHTHTYSGKATLPIKYLESTGDNREASQALPAAVATPKDTLRTPPALADLATGWHDRHTALPAPLRELLQARLSTYQLSPTHLTQFIDLVYGGPESFLLGTLLQFPSAPTPEIVFGNAMHHTLEWIQQQLHRRGTLPARQAAIEHAAELLRLSPLAASQQPVYSERAAAALKVLLDPQHRSFFQPHNVAEHSFRSEGVFIDDVHMSGQIDLLRVDRAAKKIVVVDYKTGQLGRDPLKLHKYTLQLYCYKLLVERSRSYRGYTVEQGRLLFVEPDAAGRIVEHPISFTDSETKRVIELLGAMWHSVTTLELPDVSAYKSTYTDVIRFEADLAAGTAPIMATAQ